MTVYVSNLVINSGTDFEQSFDLESAEENSALNLDNYSVFSQIRKHSGSSNYISFTTQVTDSSSGQIIIKLTSEQSSNLKPGRYVYDIIVQNNISNIKTRVIEGMVLVREGVTKL
jgi:hypothetical protein